MDPNHPQRQRSYGFRRWHLLPYRGEHSEVEIARIYGVHDTMLSKWKHQFLDNGVKVFGGNDEVKRYEKKVAERLLG